MRNVYFLIIVLLFVGGTMASAKDVYLSASGNDSNNGLTSGTPVKTLSRVNEIVASGDVIHIEGIIKLTEEPDFSEKTMIGSEEGSSPEDGIFLYHRGFLFRKGSTDSRWNEVTFLGEDPTKDGFSGQEKSPIFQFEGAYPATFRNLSISDGITRKAPGAMYSSDCSAVWARSTELTFDNCIFNNNDVARNPANPADSDGQGNQGAIFYAGGNLTLRSCEFTGNYGIEGGCLFLSGGNVLIEDCYFAYNDCAELNDSKGGVIYTWVHGANGGLTLTIKESVFEGNSAKKGGVFAFIDKASYNPTSTVVNIDRCSFIGNAAPSERGGALFLDNFMGRQSSDKITISNTLFYGNYANQEGGAICVWNVQPNSELKLVNCTFNANSTAGSPAQGGGIGLMNGYETYLPANIKKTFYNCIFDGNFSESGGQSVSDLASIYGIEVVDHFDVQNSYIGRMYNMVGRPGFDPAKNNLNYMENVDYDNGATAGLVNADHYATTHYAIPLLENAPTRLFGNAAFLIGDKDLSGKPRVLTSGKSAIGACEVTAEELDNGTLWNGANILSESVNITDPTFRIDNNRLYCAGNFNNDIRIELFDLAGRKCLSGTNGLPLNSLFAGVYAVRAQIEGRYCSGKIIIK